MGPLTLALGPAGRFIVSVAWASLSASGNGNPIPINPTTGSFWFFSPDNLELFVKVLDGRALNGHWWVFYGSLTDVEFAITVTDSKTGEVRTYSNPQGVMASRGDTEAFAEIASVEEPPPVIPPPVPSPIPSPTPTADTPLPSRGPQVGPLGPWGFRYQANVVAHWRASELATVPMDMADISKIGTFMRLIGFAEQEILPEYVWSAMRIKATLLSKAGWEIGYVDGPGLDRSGNQLSLAHFEQAVFDIDAAKLQPIVDRIKADATYQHYLALPHDDIVDLRAWLAQLAAVGL